MAKAKEKFAEPWKEFAARWERYYTPPGRPSEQAINIYKGFVRKAVGGIKRQPRALVLGSTPELRDLLKELGCRVAIVDINLEMILAMTELLEMKNQEEIMVRGNWISTPLASHYFDVVLGDIVLSNVPAESQEQFLKEIIRILKPRGYFITKMEVIPNDWAREDFDAVLNRYAKIPYHRNRPIELFVHLHNNAWDSQTNIISVSKIRKWMEKYRAGQGKYKRPTAKISKYLNDLWEMWRPMDKQWTVKRERDIEKQISSHFTILEKRVLNDCYFKEVDQSFPIWLCQVK